MFVPFEDEVGMDLVTNNSDIVLSADFRIGTQLLYCLLYTSDAADEL